MSEIDEKKLENLAKLGRIELNESEKLKLLKDLPEILNHFQELQKIDTTNVEPMSGGVSQENIFPGRRRKRQAVPVCRQAGSVGRQVNRRVSGKRK